jgi:hypothetical protein
MEIKCVQAAIMLALLVFVLVCVAVRPLRRWLFGSPEIDGSKGFPYSRGKRR